MINRAQSTDLLIVLQQISFRWFLVLIAIFLITHSLRLLQNKPSKAETQSIDATILISKHPTSCWYGYRQAMLEIEGCQRYPQGSLLSVTSTDNPSISTRTPNSATVFFEAKSLSVTPLCAFDNQASLGMSSLCKLASKLFGLKTFFLKRVFGQFSFKTEQLVLAMVFGDRDLLTDQLRHSFETTGMLHVLAVSGMHVGLLYGLSSSVLSRFWSFLAVPTQVVMIFCFAIMVGFGASVVRASLMLSFGLFLRLLFRRPSKPFFLLLLSVVVMLTLNPWYLSQVSFQLSVSATAVIIGWIMARAWRSRVTTQESGANSPQTNHLQGGGSSHLYSKWSALLANLDHTSDTQESPGQSASDRLLAYGREVATLTLVIQLFLAPLLWWHFGAASWLGVLAAPASIWLIGPFFTAAVGYLLLASTSFLLGQPILLEMAVLLASLLVEALGLLISTILGQLTTWFGPVAMIERSETSWSLVSGWYLGLALIMLVGALLRKLTLRGQR